MKKDLYFIKLGGSIITDKKTPLKIKSRFIKNLVFQLSVILKRRSDINLIIGNGAGSFGHYFALKNKKNDQYTNFDSFGFSEINYSVKKLNFIILEKLIERKISAVSFSPSAFFFAKGKELDKIFINPIISALDQGIIPIVFGDIIFDQKFNSVIFSTEKIFKELIRVISSHYYKIKTIIYCSDVDGVYDSRGTIIKIINKNNFDLVKNDLKKNSDSLDVTGGIVHKIEESLEIALKFGVDSLIFNGTKNNQLVKFFSGEKIQGTFIRWF